MSNALPGEHLCEKHQGNHSHYDKRNCTICKLLLALHDVRMMLDHSAGICDCPHCEERKKKYKMNKSCIYERFELP